MKRILGLIFVAVAAIYLGLWIYQIGFTDGRNDAAEVYQKANNELQTKVRELSRGAN